MVQAAYPLFASARPYSARVPLAACGERISVKIPIAAYSLAARCEQVIGDFVRDLSVGSETTSPDMEPRQVIVSTTRKFQSSRTTAGRLMVHP